MWKGDIKIGATYTPPIGPSPTYKICPVGGPAFNQIFGESTEDMLRAAATDPEYFSNKISEVKSTMWMFHIWVPDGTCRIMAARPVEPEEDPEVPPSFKKAKLSHSAQLQALHQPCGIFGSLGSQGSDSIF